MTLIETRQTTVTSYVARTYWHKYMKMGYLSNYFPSDNMMECPDFSDDCEYVIKVEDFQEYHEAMYHIWTIYKVSYEYEATELAAEEFKFSLEGLEFNF